MPLKRLSDTSRYLQRNDRVELTWYACELDTEPSHTPQSTKRAWDCSTQQIAGHIEMPARKQCCSNEQVALTWAHNNPVEGRQRNTHDKPPNSAGMPPVSWLNESLTLLQSGHTRVSKDSATVQATDTRWQAHARQSCHAAKRRRDGA